MSRLILKAACLPSTPQGANKTWRAVVVEWCCDEMEEAWEARVVHFGDRDENEAQEAAVNLYEVNVWPEGTVWTEYPIRFCPFCGEEIDLETAAA